MSFIRSYLKYNEGNECPRDYILWSAYAILSLAVGRRIYYDCEHFRVYCNLYICLVGPAGNRKTFARDKAMDLLQEVYPDVIVSAECETKQGITAFMGAPDQARFFVDEHGRRVEYRPYGLFASELMNYLAIDPAGMVTFLTDIYDRKFYQYRLKNEEHVLRNPYFVMLACTVPEWLTRQVKSEEFCAGFGRRTIFVCNDSDIRLKPVMTQESHEALERCKARLREIPSVVGPYVMTPEADKWFWEEWYPHYQLPDDRFLRSWSRSKHIQMLKVAMLTAISESNERVIHINHLQLALELLNQVEQQIPMITNRLGRSELVEPAMHILSVLRNHKGFMLEKELKAITFKDFKSTAEQWQVLEHLRQTDQIRVVPVTVNGVTRQFIALPDCVVRLPSAQSQAPAAGVPAPEPPSSGQK